MKRFALILVCLLTVFGMHSQIVSSRSEAVTIKKEKKQRVPVKIDFYAKAGLNIMNANWCEGFEPAKVGATKSTVGFDIALGLMSHFRPSNPSDFYWGVEAGLTQIGGGLDECSYVWDDNIYRYEYYYPAQNIRTLGVYTTPVIGWKKALSNTLSLDLHFNPGCSFYFDYQNAEHTVTSTYLFHNTTTTSEGTYEVGQTIYSSFKIGAGLWIKKFNIDFSYRYQTFFDNDCNSYNNFILSVGYKF